ncbi:MAG: site-2 protease family protein [Acidobacteriota bacterium]
MPGAEQVAEFAIWYVVFILTLTLHEGAHALVARLGGDDTAYRGGQVSLNPWPHIRREPFGTVLVPSLTFFLSGWMMGWASAPYDPVWARRYPRRQAAMSAAGPAANLVLAAAAFAALRLLLGAGVFVPADVLRFGSVVQAAPGTPPESLAHALAFGLSVGMSLNIVLFLFNLIPLPPLDGSGVLQGLAQGRVSRFLEGVAASPMMSLVGLVLAWRMAGIILPPAFAVVVTLLYRGLV